MGNEKQPSKRARAKQTFDATALAGRLDELAGIADGMALLVEVWEDGDERASEIPVVIRSLCRQLAEGVRNAASELDEGAAASSGGAPPQR